LKVRREKPEAAYYARAQAQANDDRPNLSRFPLSVLGGETECSDEIRTEKSKQKRQEQQR
jgi:hypothetical protein